MSLLAELKRRNVIRMAGLYLVGAWLVAQISETLLPIFHTPEWVLQTIVVGLAIGFVPALIFAWVFELTPEGIKRDQDVLPGQSIAPRTAQRMNRAIIAVLMLALVYFGFDKFVLAPHREAAMMAAARQPSLAPAAAEKTAPATMEKSIAVLPFVNMSTDKENEFFADGLSEEILNALVAIDGLQVIGRTSSFQFKGKNEDLRRIGEILGAGYVLEGSVRREGDRIRVTAQLIRAGDGVHLWSQSYDRMIKDTFEVQLDVAENVSRALDIVLDDRQRARMEAVGQRNVDAFIQYQKGMNALESGHLSGGGIDMSLLDAGYMALGKAVDLDPKFAAAYYQRTDYYAHQLEEGHDSVADPAALYEKYQQDLANGLRLARLPLHRASVAIDAALISNDWRDLPALVNTVLNSDDCTRLIWFSALGAFLDRDLATAFWGRQRSCDPISQYTNGFYQWSQLYAQQPAEVLSSYERARRNGINFGNEVQVRALLMLGRTDEARKRVAGGQTQGERYLSILIAAHEGDLARANSSAKAFLADSTRTEATRTDIEINAIIGDRAAANAAAARLDANPIGPMLLTAVVRVCACGAPFDLDATPNFKARLAEAGFAWPPKDLMHYPAKDW